MFKEGLFNAFHDWIVKNEEAIGDKWFNNLLKREKEAWNMSSNAVSLIAASMWMFNTIAQFGIMAGIGPADVKLHSIPEGIDEKASKRVLLLCSSVLCLQSLPKEIAYQQIPEAKAPWRFSLAKYAMWVESHGR